MLYLGWAAAFGAMALFLGLCFRQRVENCLAPAIMLSILVLYLFGLPGLLLPGAFFCAGLGAAAALGSGVLMARRKSLCVSVWLTPGALAALLLVVYIAWAQSGRVAVGNDEFSHWAYTVKMMAHYDTLSAAHAGEMLYPTYPPALSLLEYLFVRFTPDFNESYLYRGLNLFQVSLLLPFLGRFGWKRWAGALAGMAALYLLPLGIYGEFYTDLCVDGTLALLFAYYLYTWFGRRKRDVFTFFCAGLAGAVLCLTKESGVFFALWGLGLMVWDSCNRGQLLVKKLPRAWRWQAQRGWLTVLGAVLAAALSWKVRLALWGLGGGGGSPLANLASLFGAWDERTRVTVSTFLRKLLLYPEQDAPLRLSAILWLAVGLGLLGLAGLRAPEKRGAARRLRLGLGLGFGVYALGLLYLYLFSFGEYEGTRVFSFWRYLGSWLLVPMLLGMALWLEQAARADHFQGLPGLLLAGSLLLFPFNTRPVNNLVSPATEIAQDRALRAAYPTEDWFEGGLGEEDRVYFVADGAGVYEKLCAAYTLYPNRCDSALGWNFDPEGENAMYAAEVSGQKWADALLSEGYTYVYLYSISDHFLADYGELFAEPSDLVGGGLYRVEEGGQWGVSLARVR